jgi:predicted nucleotidyltransferase
MYKSCWSHNIIFAKDFLETPEGLIFAAVKQGFEQGKALCFLRYIKDDGGWKKVTTEQANAYLKQHYPDYLHYSPVLDAHLHAVAIDRIVKHHQPKQRLQQIMQANQLDSIERDLVQLCDLLQQNGLDLTQTGITGSILVGVQKQSSDIDLVCYGRSVFYQCRAITRELIEQGQLQELNANDWQQSYDRRSCDLSFADYIWHERRKTNKAVINGRKFDLNFIDESKCSEATSYQKCGAIKLQCKVTDDTHAFDYPAEFKIDHEQFDAIVSFTATYTGQAMKGETVEVSGIVEQTQKGLKRIVVGSSREAHGEYIKVIRA